MTSLEGKVALVTGAGRGLGLAMARGLLERGAKVAMAELDRGALDAAVSGLDALAVAGDVSNDGDAERMFEETFAAFGAIHILVNNAGLGPQRFRDTDRSNVKKVWEIDLADWLLYLDANVTGHFVMTKAAMRYMRAQNWGRIVNVTTSLETMIDPANGAYGPSKAAAEALASMIAGGLDDVTGVTCNVLIPGGPADTRMISATGIYADRSKLIQPEVMLPPLLHLVSEEGGAINDRRIRAALWDPNRSSRENLERAGAPIAWPQLGGQSIHPQGNPSADPAARRKLKS